jgi:hypothetical protein
MGVIAKKSQHVLDYVVRYYAISALKGFVPAQLSCVSTLTNVMDVENRGLWRVVKGDLPVLNPELFHAD